jgi:hypothetical protein
MLTTYPHATCDSYFPPNNVWLGSPCVVRINNGTIQVSYDDEDENGEIRRVTYEGERNGAVTSYLLQSPLTGGTATLHEGIDEDVLEGWWQEGGVEGMWRIHLGEKKETLMPFFVPPRGAPFQK